MVITYGALKDSIKRHLNREDLSEDITECLLDSTIEYAIRSVLDSLQCERFWFVEKYRVVEVITDFMSLPEDCEYIIGLKSQGASSPFNYIDPLEWGADNEAESYTIIAKEVYVRKPGLYQLFYVIKTSPLITNNDTNEWVKNCHRFITSKSLSDIYSMRLKDPETGLYHQSVANEEMRLLKLAHHRRKRSGKLNKDDLIL